MDVKSAFIHGDIKEMIYMHKPKIFVSNQSLVYRLKKSLYGPKQAPRSWYAKIDSFLLSLNFFQCKSDPNVYLKLINGSLMIILLYVDDLLITGSSKDEIASLKDAMNHCLLNDRFGLIEPILGARDCSNQTRNQSASIQVCLGFSEKIQHEGLQAK